MKKISFYVFFILIYVVTSVVKLSFSANIQIANNKQFVFFMSFQYKIAGIYY
jgi:hypothetical protein